MPGMKGSKAWQQRMIGQLANDIERLHEMYPNDEDHAETLKELTRDLGRVIDFYFYADQVKVPIADIMVKRIFEEK